MRHSHQLPERVDEVAFVTANTLARACDTAAKIARDRDEFERRANEAERLLAELQALVQMAGSKHRGAGLGVCQACSAKKRLKSIADELSGLKA